MRRSMVMVFLALAVLAAGCGGDSDDADADGTTTTTVVTPEGELTAALEVEYLQGIWCDTNGVTWEFVDEMAYTGEDPNDLMGPLPIVNYFAQGSVEVTILRDDEFVVESNGEDVTFTKGEC